MTEKQFDILLEVLGGIYIQSLRNYDLLCLVADKLDADVIALKELHEKGYTLAPTPALVLTNEEDTPSDN